MMEKSNEDYTPTDNEVLELSNHFKEVLDKKEKEYKALVKKHNEMFKVIIICYSIFRLADDFFDDIDYPQESIFKALHNNIEYGRMKCSNLIHNLLPTEESDDDE